MPRQTSYTYLTHRRLLVQLWSEREGIVFSVLPSYAQHDLHDFYAPSEILTDDQALVHRTAMTKAFPSMPQKAGRAFEALQAHLGARPSLMIERYQQATTKVRRVSKREKARAIHVTAIVRPTPDIHYLSRALYHLARDDWDKAHPEAEPGETQHDDASD